MLTKELAEQDDRPVIHDDDGQSQVLVSRRDMFDATNRYQRSKIYAKGAYENHKNPPGKLPKDKY